MHLPCRLIFLLSVNSPAHMSGFAFRFFVACQLSDQNSAFVSDFKCQPHQQDVACFPISSIQKKQTVVNCWKSRFLILSRLHLMNNRCIAFLSPYNCRWNPVQDQFSFLITFARPIMMPVSPAYMFNDSSTGMYLPCILWGGFIVILQRTFTICFRFTHSSSIPISTVPLTDL